MKTSHRVLPLRVTRRRPLVLASDLYADAVRVRRERRRIPEWVWWGAGVLGALVVGAVVGTWLAARVVG